MNEKSRKKDQNESEACQSGKRREKQGEQAPALRPKPRWPKGLLLPPPWA